MVDPQELRRRAEDLGIEFYFAQFVDMYARPSAKLVPAAYLDDLVSDGAGFAGFAAGEIGQGPHDPDIARDSRPRELHAGAVAAESRALRLRRHRRRGGVAVLTRARSCAASSTARARAGFELKLGIELEYFLLRAASRRLDRDRRRSSTRSRSPATTSRA